MALLGGTEAPLHQRTRPEARDIAAKQRSTGNWFRHDGDAVNDAPEVIPTRTGDYRAKEIAEKAKGDADTWFQHDPKASAEEAEPPPKSRLTGDEAQHIKEKQRQSEKWADFEGNREYVSPRPDRLPHPQAGEILEKVKDRDTMDWYRHKAHTPSQEEVEDSKQKHPSDWFMHPTSLSQKETPRKAVPRVKTGDAEEYLHRNRDGSAFDWYGHDSTVEYAQLTPRGGLTQQGLENAARGRGEGESWYKHEHDASFEASPVKLPVNDRNASSAEEPAAPPPARVKPEAAENAARNKGIMGNVLDGDANRNYESSRPAGRAVKEEAREGADRNKTGTMGDVMGGYLPDPQKHTQNRVTSAGQQYKQRNQGTAGLVIGGQDRTPVRMGGRSNPTREARENADRNQGSIGWLMGGVKNTHISKPDAGLQRGGGSEAQSYAQRGRGTVGLLDMGH